MHAGTLEAPRGSRDADCRINGTVQPFRALLQVSDLEAFAEGVLKFDPISEHENGNAINFGFEQLQRLLDIAKQRLEFVLGKQASSKNDAPATVGDGWDNWDDFDLEIEDEGNQTSHAGTSEPLVADCFVVKLRPLLEQVEFQLHRLRILRNAWSQISCGSSCSVPWHTFRETDSTSMQHIAHKMAAEQCTPFLEALFVEQPDLLLSHWRSILDSLPETIPIDLAKRLLPAPRDSQVDTLIKVDEGAVDWYLDRAQKIIERTGLCNAALDLLRHAIYVVVSGCFPEARYDANDGILPRFSFAGTSQASPLVKALYGMYRLCAEFQKYCKVSLRQVYKTRSSLFERRVNSEILDFRAFCDLEPCQRAQCILRYSTVGTIVEDARAFAHSISVQEFFAEGASDSYVHSSDDRDLISIACATCDVSMEEALVQALLACLGGNGWDVSSFQMMAAVVEASSPAIARKDRIIQSELQLLEFILGTVYSSDQHCQATEILESVDQMYGCIPNNEANQFTEKCRDMKMKERWNELQKQADHLEGHLNSAIYLRECGIKMSLTFSDMQQACTNEPMAVNFLWNLFRILGSKYQSALWWAQIQEKVFYIHEHASKAVDQSSVYSMFVRCLVDQDHFGTEVMGGVIDDWVSKHGPTRVGSSLILLAQELANSSPALRHQSLEKAQKVLNIMLKRPDRGLAFDCVATQIQKESDFIEACGLLHDLVHFQAKAGQRWMEDLRNIGDDLRSASLASSLQRSLSAVSGAGPALERSLESLSAGLKPGTQQASDFHIDGPMQLRLLFSQPLRVATDLLHYNPSAIAQTSEFSKFCSLIGIGAEEQLAGVAPTSTHWAEVMAMCAATHLVCGNRAKAVDVTEKLLANAHPAAWKLALALAAVGDDGNAIVSGPLSFDHGSALLADAAKICPPEELPQLLKAFDLGSPLLSAPDIFAEAMETTVNECSSTRSDFQDKPQSPSFSEIDAEKLVEQKHPETQPPTEPTRCTEELPEHEAEVENGVKQRPATQPSAEPLRSMEKVKVEHLTQRLPTDSMDSAQLAGPSWDSLVDILGENTGTKVAEQSVLTAPAETVRSTWTALVDILGETDARKAVEQNPLVLQASTESSGGEEKWELGDILLRTQTHQSPEPSEALELKGPAWKALVDVLGECPENHSEPMNGIFTSALSSMHKVCPEFDFSCHGSALANEVLRCAGAGPDIALELVRAVAGVTTLQEAGLQSSSVALVAAKRAALEPEVHDHEACPAALATLVLWLAPQDLLSLLAFATNEPSIPRVRQLEVIHHIKKAFTSRSHDHEDAKRFRRAIHQAETLTLIRSVFEGHLGCEVGFPLRLDINATCESARAVWSRTVRELRDGTFMLQCVEPILDGLCEDFE